jgi:hypothetical protein
VTMTDEQAEPVEVESKAALEVVERKPEVHPEIARKNSAIEAAADAAVMMPGVPARDEFLTLAMTARMLSLSGAAPEQVRGNPYVAFHVAMVGRDLGISPSAALNLIDVIDGKKGPQLSLSPQLLNGQIRRLGLGSIRPRERTAERCVAVAYGPNGEELGESEFTWEDARMAGLVGPECQPGNHVEHTVTHQNRSWKTCGCNQGYKTYPKRMLWWRASGFAADDFFPEAGLGLYTAEELGALIDEDGRAINPMSVELPEGYEEPKAAVAPAPETVDPDVLVDLAVRIQALPDDEKADLRAKWKQNEKLSGRAVHHLNPAGARLVESMIRGYENKAKAKGYVKADAIAAVRERVGYAIGVALGLPEGSQIAQDAQDDAEPEARADDGGTPDSAPVRSDEQVAEDAGEDAVKIEIARVKGLKPAAVEAELVELGLSTDGNADAQRKRLVLAILRAKTTEVEKGSAG